MTPRNLERFKSGVHVPECVQKKVVEYVERLTTGGLNSQLTSGTLDFKQIRLEAQKMLDLFHETQRNVAKDLNLPAPKEKATISDRWVSRLMESYGFRSRTPNTYGAYLAYDDERMSKARKLFSFQRLQRNCKPELTLNFDQVWKNGYANPKKLWHRVYDGSCPARILKTRKEQVMNELAKLQESGGGERDAKRRRTTGP